MSLADISSAIGVPASGKCTARSAAMRMGSPSRSSIAGGSVSAGSASSSSRFHTRRRIHFEVSFAPHGVVPPRLSYTGTIRPISRESSGSAPSGMISNCGWIILNRPDVGTPAVPAAIADREGSSLPYTATVCPSLKRSFR